MRTASVIRARWQTSRGGRSCQVACCVLSQLRDLRVGHRLWIGARFSYSAVGTSVALDTTPLAATQSERVPWHGLSGRTTTPSPSICSNNSCRAGMSIPRLRPRKESSVSGGHPRVCNAGKYSRVNSRTSQETGSLEELQVLGCEWPLQCLLVLA